jgi:EipB-like
LRKRPERAGFTALDRIVAAWSAALACALLVLATNASAQQAPIVLVPHRAIYDLSLSQTRGDSQINGVRGRILYDFDGNACRGYSLTFRQVSELDTNEGKMSISDLRSTTWESADGKVFKFSSKNYVDERLADSVDGRAEHDAHKVVVRLDKPERKMFDLAANVVFPTEHMVRAIEAGRAGRHILNFPVYDGSESGKTVFDTLTVIGGKIAPGERQHADAAAHEPKLAGVPRWPVTISYFSRKKADRSGEQTPDYALGFDLYDNGISRALILDYNNFVVAGKLVSLLIKKPQPCP